MTRTIRNIAAVVLSVLCLSSCDGSRGRIEDDVVWDVVPVSIGYDDWIPTDDGYMVSVNVPQLTSYVCSDGMIQCYLVYGDDTQTILPSTRYCRYDVKNPDTGIIETFLYQRLIDYEFVPGTLFIYFTVSDFNYQVDYPGEMNFRLVLQQ